MTYKVIATGSSGNAALLNGKILVDIGVPYKQIAPYADDIKLVLLTHKHKDHFNAATAQHLHRRHPAIRWVCCEWMVEHLLDAGVSKMSIDVADPYDRDFALMYTRLCVVRASFIPHNVQNCAWHINAYRRNEDGSAGAERILYATDTSSLDVVSARNYDFYFIEANHKRAEIEARIAEKRAVGEYAYELEAARNHLSEEQALDWLAENAGANSQYVFLHQHKDRKKPEGVANAESDHHHGSLCR